MTDHNPKILCHGFQSNDVKDFISSFDLNCLTVVK